MVERVFAIGLKGVDVEESISFEVDRSQHVIEKRYLSHIEVLGILVHEKHTKVEKDISNCGTGFIKGIGIGEKVLWAEPLDSVHGTQASRDVHASIHKVAPNIIQGLGVSCIPG
jgi:hypothetical protein